VSEAAAGSEHYHLLFLKQELRKENWMLLTKLDMIAEKIAQKINFFGI